MRHDENKSVLSGVSVKLDVDVSEAISGLKALQREAKKATAALAELRAEQERGLRSE